MKKYYLFFILLTVAALAGCKKDLNSPALESFAKGGSTKPPTGSTQTPLIVELQSSYASANGEWILSRINSDNGDAYIDGTDNVQAIIDQYGNFIFSTNTARRTFATRFVKYDFSDPVDPSNWYVPDQSQTFNQYNYVFTTNGSTYGTAPYVSLHDLQVGASECVALTGNINGDGVNSVFKYTVRFHASKDDLINSPTAFAVVKRLSATQWQIVPGECGSTGENNIGALWTGDQRNEIWKANFHLPFSFILTKK